MEKKFHFSSAAWEHNDKRLTNQIFKILPMYDHGEDWENQQLKVLLELHGYNDALADSSTFMTLIGKLCALNHVEDQMIFRKFVFDAIDELKRVKMPDKQDTEPTE